MEYGWQNPSDFYFVINGDYIGKIDTAKHFIEEHLLGYSRPWLLEITTPIIDFYLEEFLISSTFDIYEKRYVRKRADGENKVLYYKYSDCEITKTFKEVNASGEPCEALIAIEGMKRESIAALPNIIKEWY